MTFKSHPDLPDIEDNHVVLWRYVDLYRYLDLLQTGELHLTRVDQMEDRWEGSYSTVNVDVRPSLYGDHWEMMSRSWPQMYNYARTHMYLNCWYIGDHESYAMWRLYEATGKGVAIRTTVGRLKGALIGNTELCGARIQYVDYKETFIPEGNLFFPYVHKRLSFAHESEFRLLAMWSPKVLEMDEHKTAVRAEPDEPPFFLRESVDLNQLVEAVYVSPDAPGWIARVVENVTHRYAPSIRITQSDLVDGPVY